MGPYTPPSADVAAKLPVYSVKPSEFDEEAAEREANTAIQANRGYTNYSSSDDSMTIEDHDRQMALLLQQEEIKIKKQEEDYDKRMNKHKKQRSKNRPLGQADPTNEGSSCIIM